YVGIEDRSAKSRLVGEACGLKARTGPYGYSFKSKALTEPDLPEAHVLPDPSPRKGSGETERRVGEVDASFKSCEGEPGPSTKLAPPKRRSRSDHSRRNRSSGRNGRTIEASVVAEGSSIKSSACTDLSPPEVSAARKSHLAEVSSGGDHRLIEIGADQQQHISG